MDVDLTKARLVADSPTICLLWGNARLLVGLIACAQRYDDPQALAAAKRLGDFYVETADQLCNPQREAEYRASGTYGHSYTCDYFPAIEGLAMLYRATKDDRYLKQAQRMAEFFTKFDVLPIDHSHGNLSAWRGILQLYEITGDRKYLDRARQNGTWPSRAATSGRSAASANDGTSSIAPAKRAASPTGCGSASTCGGLPAKRAISTWPSVCCTTSIPSANATPAATATCISTATRRRADRRHRNHRSRLLLLFRRSVGSHFLKSYLAAGSDRGIFVNFPVDFTSTVKAGGQDWRVAVRTTSSGRNDRR